MYLFGITIHYYSSHILPNEIPVTKKVRRAASAAATRVISCQVHPGSLKMNGKRSTGFGVNAALQRDDGREKKIR